ncbi:MAG: PAS domain S-box protein, partial [Deltaproteobacteria bacterium]|nr:PAS domain S-box protein [Deltaproteobacteria bacterium]
MKVLVVDDDLNLRETLKEMLSHFGYECKIAANGREALNLLQEEHFPIVLSDVRMPEMDGIELLKKTKKNYPEIDVIIITGYGKEHSFIDMVKAGASDFIVKPFSCDELEAKISRIVREKELKEKERLMALFAELDPSPVLRFDKDGKILMANPSAIMALPKKSQSVIGMSLASLIPGLERVDLTSCIKDGTVVSYSTYIKNHYFHFILKGIPELGIGQIYGRNITDRKGAEEELQIRANKSFMKMLGYKEEELLGKHITEFSINESGTYESSTGESVKIDWGFFHQDATTKNNKLPEGEKVSQWENYFIRKDNTVVPTELTISYLHNHEGAIIGSVAVIRNITERKRTEEELTKHRYHLEELVETRTAELMKVNEKLTEEIADRKQAEKALRKSEKRFRDLVENSLTGILIIQNDKIIYQNPEQERLVSLLPKSFSFKDFKNIHTEDVEKVKQFYHTISSGKSKKTDLDFRFTLNGKNDSTSDMRWVNCRASLIDYQGEDALLFNMMDITRAKELEHLLRIKDKMTSLGRVAAGIAHELRNPLSGINIFLTTLERSYDKLTGIDPGDLAKGKNIIEQLRSASDRIELVVKKVMDFAKPTVPQLTQHDINNSIQEALNLSSSTLRKEGITIKTSLT